MRYQAIAAAFSAASLLAMGITAVEVSAKSSYRIVLAGRHGNITLRIHKSVLTVSR